MSWLFKTTQHSQLYSKFRPQYPKSLYEWILSKLQNPQHQCKWKLAVDVGCGTGFSTLPLSEHFESVVGVDVSESQLAEARALSSDFPNVSYRQAEGHQLEFLQDESVDLMTIAQAIHWLDTAKFYKECQRVLRLNGVLAAYGYGTSTMNKPDGDALLLKFYKETLKGYWEDGRSHIDDLYARIYPEFSRSFVHSLRDDSFSIKKDLMLEDFIGYLRTWSGYQKLRAKTADQPDQLETLGAELRKVYGDQKISLTAPVFVLIGIREKT